MEKLQNTFVGGKMNKDIDERLLPKGLYPHAKNVRVVNSDGSDMGAIENVKGNKKLTDLFDLITNQTTIGALADDANQLLYYFVASDQKDLVVEYDVTNDQVNVLLESSSGGILNFDVNTLITGVNKIVNEDPTRDMLIWTDDRNPPRMINISRFRGSVPDSFTELDISVIKPAPPYAPTYSFLTVSDSSIDSMEDKFFRYATRFKYEDGQFSAASAFTEVAYSPNTLFIDLDTLENRGMANTSNALDITFDSGGKNVIEIQLLLKEEKSNTVYIVEKFDKEQEGIGDSEPVTYRFKNDKTLVALPENELFRTFDNVPPLAKAQDIVNNRLMYSNYAEGFDIKNEEGDKITLDYDMEIVSNEIEGEPLLVELANSDADLNIYLNNMPLVRDTRLTIFISLIGTGDNVGATFAQSYVFILPRDYTDYGDLGSSAEFTSFIEETMTDIFYLNEDSVPPVDTVSTVQNPFAFTLDAGGLLTINSPTQEHTNAVPETVIYEWVFTDISEAEYNTERTSASIKTNRNLEVVMIYQDEFGRKSTGLAAKENTVDVPQSLAQFQNKLKISVNHEAPADAVRYQFAVKQNKGFYENIFCTKFYEDDQFVWIKLEDSNKDKVQAGDVLYVKRDTTGLLSEPVKVTVLEVSQQEKNFIEGNFFNLSTGELVPAAGAGIIELIEPAGIYMKVKPNGFTMNYNANTFFRRNYFQDSDSTFPTPVVTGRRNATDFFPITQGAIVEVIINNSVERTSRVARATRRYIAEGEHTTFRDFWLAEVGLAPIVFDSGTAQAGSAFVVADTGTGISFRAIYDGYGRRRTSSMNVQLRITNNNGLTVMETVPPNNISETFYETSEVFDIVNGVHQGKETTQVLGVSPAEHTLDFFNCFAMGEGVESIAYLDGFNKPFMDIDVRPTAISVEEFRRVRRLADITYSGTYVENTNQNRLNEFNLATANFKDDLDKAYGSVQRIYSRDTNLVVFQEDKVSYILYGKDLLMNADGSSNITGTEEILGQQIPYTGEYGISKNPESFAFNGNNIYFADVKRGCVLRLANNGITEISANGMRRYFVDKFKDEPLDYPKMGAFDPYLDQYVFTSWKCNLNFDEGVKGWTSFASWLPEFMIGMNNKFYSFDQGELYEHHSDDVPRNTFYGQQFDSEIRLMVNDAPSDVKILQSISLEGNYAWDVELQAFVDMSDDTINSSIASTEFAQKEGLWYAYARRNENVAQTDSKAVYGIGVIQTINGNDIVVNGFSSLLTSGDEILRADTNEVIGTVVSHETSSGTTTITMATTPTSGTAGFIYGRKNPRIEGGNLRGYVIAMDLTVRQDDKVELFAVNSNVKKSYS